jgi:flagellar biosynthetic protein FlhB
MTFTRAGATVPEHMIEVLGTVSLQAALAVSAAARLLLAAAVLAPLMIGGWTFSTSAMAPDLQRLDPVAGLGRVFSLNGLIEVTKSLARFAVVAVVAALVLRHQFRDFTLLGAAPVRAGIGQALLLCGQALMWLGGALGLIAMIDVPLALWQHHRRLKMSRQEIRDESKETDGNPEVRGRIRQLQNEMSRRRMMEEVPRADVIVTNPTHYAVALRYDEDRMRAPIVVAKGVDLIALQIRRMRRAPIADRRGTAGPRAACQLPARRQFRTVVCRGGPAPDLCLPAAHRATPWNAVAAAAQHRFHRLV